MKIFAPDITGSLNIDGHITASGNISASGIVYADAFQSSAGGDSISFGDDLNIEGDITASGNISGSSTSTGSFGSGIFAGHVGINTPNPVQQFVITSTGTNQYLQRWVSSDGSTLGGFFEESDTSGRFFVNNAGGSIGVQLDTGGDSFFAGGNVGIGSAFAGGAASPDGTLHVHTATAGSTTANANADDLVVENSDHGGISILTPDDKIGYLVFGDASDSARAGFQYYHAGVDSNERLLFNVSGGEKARLTDAGDFVLSSGDVSGSATSTGSFGMVHGANEIRINPTKTINTTVDNNYWVLYGGTSGNGANIALSGNSRSTYGGRLDIAAGNVDSAGGIAFNTGGAERMQIDYSGRVGIGTSTPDVKLQIMGNTAVSGSESGNLDFTVRNTHASALSRVIVQNNGVDQNMILFADDANDYGSVGSSTGGSNNIRFKTGTDAYFEGGKFGINAVNPQYDLHVSGSGFVGIAAQSSGSGAGMFSDDINGRSYIMLDDNVSGHSGFGSGTDYTSFMRQNAKTTLISYGSTQGFEIGNYSSDEIDFITNNIRRMTIEAGGSVEVVGALSKGSGTFRIPHPVPEKKDKLDLQHSFVESPTRGDNIYRWQVEVQNNQHIIELPDYYQYLNENDMVWVNSVNHFGRGYGNVNDEQTELTITTDTDGLYNVLLIGTRKDETAMNNFKGIEVERKLETFKGVVPPK